MKTTSKTISIRQQKAARKAWVTRRYAEMVALQDGIEEALEALARGLYEPDNHRRKEPTPCVTSASSLPPFASSI